MPDDRPDNVRAPEPITIGPEHPEYRQLLAAQENSPDGRKRNKRNNWLMALGCTALGLFMWWSNVHDAHTENKYGVFTLIFSPIIIVGGIVGVFMLLTQKEEQPGAVVPEISGTRVAFQMGGIALACIALGALQYYQIHH